MKEIIAASLIAVTLIGCSSPQTPRTGALDTFHEKEIYSTLRNEPIPLPKTTRYDRDSDQRNVFERGFRNGWDCAISGALLHGTFGTPADLNAEMRRSWSAGWDAGTRKGTDRWLLESQRRRGPKRPTTDSMIFSLRSKP